MNIAQENAAKRAQAGVRSVSHAQLTALTNTTKTATRAESDVYSNPPDGYKLALEKLAPEAPTVGGDIYSSPPDGYRIALDEIARQKSNPSTPSPASSVAPDGYKIALDKQRKEAL